MIRIYLSRYWFAYAALLLACSCPMAGAASLNWDPATHHILQADFNHDGYPDLLFQAKTAADKHYLVLGQNSAAQRYDYTNPIELPQKINQVHWHREKFQLLALTTTAQDDAALMAIANNGSSAWLFKYINSAADLSVPTQHYDSRQFKWLRASPSSLYYSGDFNGDGKADLLQLDSIKGEHQLILAEKQHHFGTAKKLSKTVQWGLKNNERLIIRDFNKDGHDDVFALSKDGKQPHVLLYSEGKGRFASDDGKLIPVRQADVSWSDSASGITAVRRKSDHQTVLFRAYNHAERTVQNSNCAGRLFDTETMIAEEYCPVVSIGNTVEPSLQSDITELQGCPGDMIAADEITTLQACPGGIIPKPPTEAPRVSFNQAAQGVQFNVVLASNNDYNALTYQLSAQDPSGNLQYLGTVAAPTTLSPPKPTASLKVSINTAGNYQLMYRSCNYNGCSGFGPSSTITILSPVVSHTVTATATDGGSIAPTNTKVIHGQTTSFNLSTAVGFVISSVQGCNGKLSGSTYTTGSINAGCEVDAAFSRQSYVVGSSTDGGGTISPTPSTKVLHGDRATFNVTPGIGKEVLDIKGCNGQRTGNAYVTGPITSVCDVHATFKAQTFTVKAKAAANGTIAPPKQTVEYGKTTTFVVTPDTGYSPDARGCNGELVGTIYTTGAITSDCEVDAVFSRKSYVVGSSTDGGGTISPTPSTKVLHGDRATFNVTPGIGKEVQAITGCNGKRSGNSYVTGPITSTCDVKATFKTKVWTVTTTATANGTIDPPEKTVDYGKTTTFVVTPNTGYSADAWGCNGKLVGSVYTTGAITADCQVSATFSQRKYSVTTTAGENGTISAGKTVNHGQTTAFTVTPNTGYTAAASGCGGSLSGKTYTTAAITGACTVTATFTAQPSVQTIIYLHTDVLGSVIVETDASGNVKKRTEYKPFGESKDN